MGGTVMQGMSMQQVSRHLLVEELGKQYEIEEVDLNPLVITPDGLVAIDARVIVG
jgi:succinyl-CoA synthetase beta subunit